MSGLKDSEGLMTSKVAGKGGYAEVVDGELYIAQYNSGFLFSEEEARELYRLLMEIYD